MLFREILEVYLGKTAAHTEFNIKVSNQQDSHTRDAFPTVGNAMVLIFNLAGVCRTAIFFKKGMQMSSVNRFFFFYCFSKEALRACVRKNLGLKCSFSAQRQVTTCWPKDSTGVRAGSTSQRPRLSCTCCIERFAGTSHPMVCYFSSLQIIVCYVSKIYGKSKYKDMRSQTVQP